MREVVELHSDDSNIEGIEMGPDVVELGTESDVSAEEEPNNVILLDDTLTEPLFLPSSPGVLTSDLTEEFAETSRPAPLLVQRPSRDAVTQDDIINNLTSILTRPRPQPHQALAARSTPSPLFKQPLDTPQDLDSLYEKVKATNPKLLKLVNKRKTKTDIQAEMVVAISTACDTYFKSLNPVYFEMIDYKTTKFDSDIPQIKFIRKVTAQFNDAKLAFVPVEPYEEEEDVVVLVLEMERIVELLPQHGLRRMIHTLKAERQDRKIVVFANNHDRYLNKLKANVNKQYDELTRMHLGSQSGEPPQKRRNTANKPTVTVKPEQVLLQIKKYEARGVTFQRLTGLTQVFDWLKTYAYAVGKRVYDQFELNKDVAHLSKEKSGQGSKDTFGKMLTSIPRLTERKAQTILQYSQLDSMMKMYNVFQEEDGIPGELATTLQRDVVASLKRFFTSEDENESI